MDLAKEQSLSLREVPDLIEEITGQRISYSTAWRWAVKGYNGIRLETFRVCSSPRTTKQAVMRFLEKVNVGNDVTFSMPATAKAV